MPGGEDYFGIVNGCIQNRQGANHTLLGGLGACPPRKKICPEIEFGGFWYVADYPTVVFKITVN